MQEESNIITYVSLSDTYVKKNDPIKIVVGLSKNYEIKSADLILYNEKIQKEYTITGNITDEGNLYFETESLDEGTNVYPMSRTFSFLFSKYLDTKFYGIPGFIQ